MTQAMPSRRPAAAAVVLGLAAMALGACSKPLLSPSDERTPFDRYDTVRNEYAKQYVDNEFGRIRPNLRGRLAPR
jgi:hypothetical protein